MDGLTLKINQLDDAIHIKKAKHTNFD